MPNRQTSPPPIDKKPSLDTPVFFSETTALGVLKNKSYPRKLTAFLSLLFRLLFYFH
ncbi:hypothetical protein HMPREF1555_02036 [Porphyromonas gingivalis F0570]|uniref:Uncharacterized protein n=1 Tax=Porphyromonas gingivalis F0570 TaxID=1227271 RepID=A0A0E2LMU4_PORGN|nr:hypothetical protein HMPREF1555_02036 [Porphyromonas gingivalis F0570]